VGRYLKLARDLPQSAWPCGACQGARAKGRRGGRKPPTAGAAAGQSLAPGAERPAAKAPAATSALQAPAAGDSGTGGRGAGHAATLCTLPETETETGAVAEAGRFFAGSELGGGSACARCGGSGLQWADSIQALLGASVVRAFGGEKRLPPCQPPFPFASPLDRAVALCGAVNTCTRVQQAGRAAGRAPAGRTLTLGYRGAVFTRWAARTSM
jgi:hypothetical protein